MKAVSGWGQFPRIRAQQVAINDREQLSVLLAEKNRVIARGLGRSYGDSSLAPSEVDAIMVNLMGLNRLTSFDSKDGILTAEAGISFAELIEVFLPQGWFVPVTAGTKHITLGGAVASDIHGKNHHHAGSFGDHVLALDIMLGDGSIVTASRTEHPDLFAATVGGMGLTGIILTVTVRLRQMRSSNIVQRTLKMPTLDAVLDGFEEHHDAHYSVAWIDPLTQGRHFGRSLLMLGEEADDGVRELAKPTGLNVPMVMPVRMVNRATSTAFDALYYGKEIRNGHTRTVNYDAYYYQLDAVNNWHRLYGKSGFVQYQFALPEASGRAGLTTIFRRIVESGLGTPITVLKKFGAGNDSPLSFPTAGYTLAIDFPATAASFALLTELDELVVEWGGRIYLTKDARMNATVFQASYPRWEEFQAVRERYHALGSFASAQSVRLGLDA